MFRNKSASQHQFAMVPNADIPRSNFNRQMTYKTSFDAGYLVPVLVDEVLPGDTINLNMTAFGRLATPLFPVMDNLHLDSFFFFVPNRLVWSNWKKFMGEQANPADSISYVIPQQVSPTGGYAVGSLQDYMGLPTVGQVGAGVQQNESTAWYRFCVYGAVLVGYQERWGEYRYGQSKITSLFRSTSAGTIDPWHLAQKFTALPTLNTTFIQDTPPVSRVVAVGASANGQQFLFDAFFDVKSARPMPMFSVPGLIDHF